MKRYKIIADFPGLPFQNNGLSYFALGDVIELSQWEEYVTIKIEADVYDGSTAYAYVYFHPKDYPHLFEEVE